MSTAQIGSVVEPVSKWDPRKHAAGEFTYIDLSAIDQQQKLISRLAIVPSSEAPSRARQLVATGDVLVSTVRPNLNAVAQVPPSLDGATASTGFSVLRPSEGQLDGRYLFHWIQSGRFIDEMVRLATGASYPAVSDKIVKASYLPLPPIEEQRRITAVLDAADALRAKRRQTIAKLDSLTQAIFIDMFGDPVANPKGLPTCALTDLGTLDRGVSKHRPRNDPALLGGPWPLIQTGDVANSGGYIREFSTTYSDFGLSQSKLWPEGTLCITIAANIAKTGILTFDACFPDSVVGFTSELTGASEFVRVFLNFLQPALEKQAPESAQKNINLKVLRSLQVPRPNDSAILEFAHVVESANIVAEQASHQGAHLDTLFGSLQQRAFRGEL